MSFVSWIGLRERSPIDISRLVSHAQGFNSLVGIKISINNLNNAKRSLMEARVKLDLMITSLQQLLYDRTILKSRIDEILYGWLIDNLGRYLKNLDEKEEELLIKYDEVNSPIKRVGVARLSAYAKALKLASESLIYESLSKSISEYEKIGKDGIKIKYDFEEEGKKSEREIVIEKEPRTFLYILFQVLQVTLSLLGGVTREGKLLGSKKGHVGSYPTTWQSLMTLKGQKNIAEKYKEETGEKIKVDESMVDKNKSFGDEDADTIYLEEMPEGEENDK